MNAQDIISALNGLTDEDIKRVADAASLISKQRAEQALLTVSVGDTVRINEQCRPKYMVGRTATVVKVNTKGVVIHLHEDASPKFRAGRDIRLPATLMERV